MKRRGWTRTGLAGAAGNSLDAVFQGSLNGDAVVAFALPGPHYKGPHITYSDKAFASAGPNVPAASLNAASASGG